MESFELVYSGGIEMHIIILIRMEILAFVNRYLAIELMATC